MKITIETPQPGGEDEIIVRCASLDPKLMNLIYALKMDREQQLTGYQEDKIVKLSPKDIFYFESVDNKVFAYLGSGEYEIQKKLYEIEEEYAGTDFLRISKSAIVNVAKIAYIRPIFNGRFEAKLKVVNKEIEEQFKQYRISEALMTVYRLFWDEFSAWYLEMVKPAYVDGQQQPIDKATYDATLGFFDTLLKMLHPFMPFITEELWQHLYERAEGESIMKAELHIAAPDADAEKFVSTFENVKEVVAGVRAVRNQKNIAPKVQLELDAVKQNAFEAFNSVIVKIANLKGISVVDEKAADASAFMVGVDEFAVPVGDLIDVKAEIEKAEKELKHLEGFLTGVEKKLSNENFVAHAPEAVVERERKKKSDAEEKIAALKASIEELKKK